MAELIEMILGVEVAASIIVTLVLLWLSLRWREALTSDAAKVRLNEGKIRFFAAFFLGIVAASMFIGIELFEAGNSLALIHGFEAVEELFEALQVFFMLSSQILILSLVLEVRRHGE